MRFLFHRKRRKDISVDDTISQKKKNIPDISEWKGKLAAALPDQQDIEKAVLPLEAGAVKLIQNVRQELDENIRRLGNEIRKEMNETYRILKLEQRKQICYQWVMIFGFAVMFLVRTFLR